jgi:hypothetical protein
VLNKRPPPAHVRVEPPYEPYGLLLHLFWAKLSNLLRAYRLDSASRLAQAPAPPLVIYKTVVNPPRTTRRAKGALPFRPYLSLFIPR